MVAVVPEPLGPRYPYVSPSPTVRDTPRTALVTPYRLNEVCYLDDMGHEVSFSPEVLLVRLKVHLFRWGSAHFRVGGRHHVSSPISVDDESPDSAGSV
jgi:hypothetical protein